MGGRVNQGETPTLEQVIRTAIEARLCDVHVSLPCIIQRYDAAKQQADVVPALQRVYADGRVSTLPVISNCPVIWPRVAGAILHMPMKPGDHCVAVFSERSLDNYLEQGKIVDPADDRKHHLSDACIHPGGYPFSKPATLTDSEAVTLQFGSSELLIKPDGTVSIKAANINLGDHSLTKFVAIAEKVATELAAIKTSYDAHTHISGAPAAPTGPAVPPLPAAGSVASSTVKVME